MEAGQLPPAELRVPETSAASPTSDPFDDLTAELLGLRERQVEVQSRDTRSASALSNLSSSINAIAGMPLAVWVFLDTLLPEPLRSGMHFVANDVLSGPCCLLALICGNLAAVDAEIVMLSFHARHLSLCNLCSAVTWPTHAHPHSCWSAGQDLTEEVQRAVLATKGIVLIVSSTLAYFVARGLSRQLVKAAAGIPLLRALADASSAAAESISKLQQKIPNNVITLSLIHI